MYPEKLTIVERQILSNQFRILSKLFEENSYERKNNEIKAEILENGFTLEYTKVFNVNIKEISIDVCEETYKILNMFRHIQFAISSLTEDEKEKLDLDKIKFEGFDKENDPHYKYAKYIIENLDKWEEYKNNYLNSHCRSTLIKYRKMLSIQDLANKFNRGDLNFDYLEKMINSII